MHGMALVKITAPVCTRVVLLKKDYDKIGFIFGIYFFKMKTTNFVGNLFFILHLIQRMRCVKGQGLRLIGHMRRAKSIRLIGHTCLEGRGLRVEVAKSKHES